MLAQRGEAAPARGSRTAKPADPVARKAAPEKAAPEKPRPAKMNFADAHALKTLPDKIAKAEAEMLELEKTLSDSGLYARDPKAFADLSARLAALRAAKDADEERWLALELAREALG
jgi:ATP-binding cassette subfamily F protein uup